MHDLSLDASNLNLRTIGHQVDPTCFALHTSRGHESLQCKAVLLELTMRWVFQSLSTFHIRKGYEKFWEKNQREVLKVLELKFGVAWISGQRKELVVTFLAHMLIQ